MKNKWKFHKKTIKRSIVLKMCLINSGFFCVAFLLTMVISSMLNYREISRKEEEGFHTYIVDSLLTIDNKLKDMEKLSLMSTTADGVQQIIQNCGEQNRYLQRDEEEYLQSNLTAMITWRNDINGIYLFAEREMIYYYDEANPSYNGSMDAYEVLNDVRAKAEGMLTKNCRITADELPAFLKYGERYNKEPYYNNCLWMIRDIYSFSPYEQIGSIALVMPAACFYEMLNETIGKDMFYVLCTDSGKIVCCNEKNLIGKSVGEISDSMQKNLAKDNAEVVWLGEKCLMSQVQSEYSGLRLIAGKPKSVVIKEVTYFVKYSILLGIMAIAFVVCLTFYSAKWQLQPLEKLSSAMSDFDENSLHLRFPVQREDEVGVLIQSFNEMLDMLEGLIQNKYLNEMKIKESELTEQKLSMLYLKNQVNPHFLYNTLDTIRIQAQINEDKVVADLLMQLVEFFRLSVKVDQPMVLLEHELKLLQAYMKLMCYRYPGLRCAYDVSAEFNDILVPNFMLQPIVENSLLHGLRNKGYQGEVKISVHNSAEYENCIEITVSDTGVGFDVETRRQVEEMLLDEKKSENEIADRKSIGIINVQRRIKMLYGEQCGLWYTDNETAGVTAHALLRIIR